ncbi:MAG: substrate-binding domain-containing protein [Thermoplasmatales archaeon]|nr:substrate-binding domain-containing protein [Candidatus Thermoplasmatota archaeon]MDA8054239.1 substrate-binding domain-containing protein [Thermoplasmatales archaeon]
MSKRSVGILLVLLVVIGFVSGVTVGHYVYSTPQSKSQPITVFAAGSLTFVLGSQFYPQFENVTGIKVVPTFGGSVSGASEIDAGTPFDVFVSAAAGVIPQYLFANKTANWMVIFASNEMAITWLNTSYRIAGPYWFENLTAPDIKVGVSNASLDPSGFQAIETVKLAGVLYTQYFNNTPLGTSGHTIGYYVQEAWSNNSTLYNRYNTAWNDWFGPNGTLVKDNMGNGYPLNYPLALYYQLFNYSYKHGNLLPTTEEYGLDGYLTAGSVDYALTYKSQAVNQHLYYYKTGSGENGLPSWINLGNISKADVTFYGTVTTAGPGYSNIGNFPGGPILYSATILESSRNTQYSQQLIYYLVSNLGSSLLSSSNFDPISTPFLYAPTSAAPSLISGISQPVPSYIPASSYEEV